MSPSSRGLGHRVLIPATWVRIPLEMPFFCLFFQESLRNPRKKQATAWQINLPVVAFSFCRYFFAMQKKWDYSLSCGLPILQKISLRRRESRLAARALPSAVKSIFRRPRSAAFRRHPPYSCLEYGSVDYIIFVPALRRASPSLSNPARTSRSLKNLMDILVINHQYSILFAIPI